MSSNAATIAATRRDDSGKGAARKLRAAGQIPAIVYGQGTEATAIALDPKPLLEVFRKTQNRNTRIDIDLGDETIAALVREAQRHPVSRDVLHIDFYRVVEGTPIKVLVPVKPVGKHAGASLGGRIDVVRRDLWVTCDPNAIPDYVEVDVTPLNIGDIVKVSTIAVGGGTIAFDQDFPVVRCVGKKK